MKPIRFIFSHQSLVAENLHQSHCPSSSPRACRRSSTKTPPSSSPKFCEATNIKIPTTRGGGRRGPWSAYVPPDF
ncbi:hypothetical protein L484_021138 [Morus notabilis]|uniref:Uncharacterized protein n=1 Tax=Morus notabilis TaxID=981085 RepID=W9QY73_9ROSA|nr:hypothetical protein L484_021138 [Morus notabilis]